jgi:hypothetical protein
MCTRGGLLSPLGMASKMKSRQEGAAIVRSIYVLIGASCLIITLILVTRPFTAQGRGGGCYVPKGPFQQLTGEFQYDYKRYGAVGKEWESVCTREMSYAIVKAHANPEGGGGSWPEVEFIVWFLGPMKSDNPKCTFGISDGGEVKAITKVTRNHLNVIAVPKVVDDSGTRDFSNLQSNTPWTIRFTCTSE